MSPEEKNVFNEQFSLWVDSIVSYDHSIGVRNDFRAKLDLIERAIQLARFNLGENENQLGYRDFLKLSIRFGNEKIIFLSTAEPVTNVLIEPHKPPELQIPLAVHLLVNHGKNKSIYNIIESFIDEIRTHLTPLDFEKTQTGVIRCFTNTRFAAKGLRDQGLLKFTRGEAYRTWELSFIGILVAGFLYYEDWRDINFDDNRFDPWKTIYNVIQLIGKVSEDDFVRILAALCDQAKAEEEYFISFKDKVKSILPLIKRYACTVHDEKEGLQKRNNIAGIIAKIEAMPVIEKFLRDFRCEQEMVDFNLKIRRFLKNS